MFYQFLSGCTDVYSNFVPDVIVFYYWFAKHHGELCCMAKDYALQLLD